MKHLAWPVARAAEAMEVLARRHGMPIDRVAAPVPPAGLADEPAALGRWIEAAAGRMGLETEAVETSYAEVADMLRAGAPLLVATRAGILAVTGARRGRLRLVGPDHALGWLPLETVRAELCAALEAPAAARVDALLAAAGISGPRAAAARAGLLSAELGPRRVGSAWLLRLSPAAPFLLQLRRAGVGRHFALVVAASLAHYALFLTSWWLIGRGALAGHVETGWIWAWALLLATAVPLRLASTWSQGMVSLGVGSLLKQRLLLGALRLDPEEVRDQGAGRLFARVLDSEALESMALGGGFTALVGAIELTLAAMVVAAGSWLLFAALVGWVAVSAWLAARYLARRRRWTEARLEMTHELVERMVGHRTRLAQEAPEHWHDGEDEALERYLEDSRRLDRGSAIIRACVPRGWLLVAILALAPALVAGSMTPLSLALTLGGIVLAFQALDRLPLGLVQLASADVAWRNVRQLYQAATRPVEPGAPAYSSDLGAHADGAHPVLEARELSFRYRPQGEPVLRGCALRVHTGDRILLEGASGGGKSTLASLLVGLRRPESGLLLLHGLDRQTVGSEGWRRRIAAAPQFHENHILTESFAFNLLMGREWPGSPADFQEAETVCRELGLGPLLERMPSGILQMVGETGWQLSHGEKSRLYIARALLQRAEVVVLDESLAALDPESLAQALRCVRARARTLIVIAHP